MASFNFKAKWSLIGRKLFMFSLHNMLTSRSIHLLLLEL